LVLLESLDFLSQPPEHEVKADFLLISPVELIFDVLLRDVPVCVAVALLSQFGKVVLFQEVCERVRLFSKILVSAIKFEQVRKSEASEATELRNVPSFLDQIGGCDDDIIKGLFVLDEFKHSYVE